MTDHTIHVQNPNAREPFEAARLTGDATAEDIESIRRRTSVYVYEAPVRLWHWTNALCILVLIVTGYLIGSPLPARRHISLSSATSGLPISPPR